MSDQDPSPRDAATHTVLSVLRGAEAWLDKRRVEAARRSAELLLGKVLGMTRLELYLAHDRPLGEQERAAMRGLLVRRGDGEPVAHLLGNWGFRGLELEVSPAVLVPRPETEELVDEVLPRLPAGARVLDLGTGSGAIAIAIAVVRPDVQVVAVDVSQNALTVAARNAARHGVADRVAFRCGSWWEAVPDDARFGAVVSNPPYIDPAASAELAIDVRAHEPPLALFTARGDVLSCYRAIVAGLEHHLEPGGWFVAETGVGASGPALGLLRDTPFLGAAELRKDLGGVDRFLLAQRVATA